MKLKKMRIGIKGIILRDDKIRNTKHKTEMNTQ